MTEEDIQSNIELVIITGISGGGKTKALRILEDIGYFCVDNFIPALLKSFVQLISSQFDKIAVVIDTRGGGFFSELSKELQSLKGQGVPYRIIFLEASEQTLVNRFSETRRKHPLVDEETALLDSIRSEKALLEDVRKYADYIIDTSNLSLNQLKQMVLGKIIDRKLESASMRISIMSFGYKYGLPPDADLVFDVRFLPNPHYVPELKAQTGLEQPVREFIFEKELTREFLQKFLDFVNYLVPHYKEEGKSLLTVAVGCTGGRHRSVAVATKLSEALRGKGYYISEKHRDIKRNQSYYTKINK